jgi:hypothetical protein
VPLVAVVLDRDPPLRVRRVDPGDEAPLQLDLELQDRFGKAATAQDLEEPGLHLARCPAERRPAQRQHLAQLPDAVASRPSEPLQRAHELVMARETKAHRPVRGDLDRPHAADRAEIDQRPRGRRHRHTIHVGLVEVVERLALVNDQPIVAGARPAGTRDLDEVLRPAGQAPERGGRPVRGVRTEAARPARSEHVATPLAGSSHEPIRPVMLTVPEPGGHPPMDLAVREPALARVLTAEDPVVCRCESCEKRVTVCHAATDRDPTLR